MKKLSNRGFSAVEGLLILVVAGVIGGVGYYVWNNQKTDVTENNSSVATETSRAEDLPAVYKNFTLANGTVSFQTPEGWIKDGVGCPKDVDSAIFSGEDNLDSVALLPSEKPTYKDGKTHFNVNVCVFNNPNKLSPKDWHTSDKNGSVNLGYPSDNDKSSDAQINGQPAYYVKSTSGEHEYDEVTYVVAVKNNLVYVQARIYETNETGGLGDFREYEDDVKAVASSINIKEN